MAKSKEKEDEDYQSQYVWGANENYDAILYKLRKHLFNNGKIDKNSKWTLTKFALFRLLFDYGDEIVKGFEYTPEQLIEIIEYHTKMKEKFEGILRELAANKQEITEKILSQFEVNSEEDEKEDG